MTDAEIAQLVTAWVERELEAKGFEHRLGPDDPLISGGLLSSVDVLGLVAHLEDELGVEIAAHEISPDSMDTVSDIVALVRGKTG